MELTKQNSYLKEYVLKCPICYELFSSIHKPFIIPCGHTICSICLENLKKISAEDYDEDYASEFNDEEFDMSLESEEEEENIDHSAGSEEEEGHEEVSESSEGSEEEDNEDSENEILLENLNAPDINLDDFVNSSRVNANMDENILFDLSEAKLNSNNKKIKIKCSICRKRMKIIQKDILLNLNIIKVVDYLNSNENIFTNKDSIEGNTNVKLENIKKEEKQIKEDKRIFCKMCRFVDTENSHLSNESSRNHKEYFVFLGEESFNKMKNFYLNSNSTLNFNNELNKNDMNGININDEISNSIDINSKIESKNEKVESDFKKMKIFSDYFCMNDIKELIISAFSFFFEKLINSQEYLNSAQIYIKNYFMINSKAGYLKNKSYRKLTKLYEKYNDVIVKLNKEEEKSSEKLILQKANNCIEAAEVLCDKYYEIIGHYIDNYEKIGVIESSSTKSKEFSNLKKIIDNTIKFKVMKILNNEFFNSYWNNLLKYERRYAVSSYYGGDKILIFDLRVENELQVNYDRIFSELKEEESLTQDQVENLYTESVEVDDDGRYLYLIGKRSKPSKAFRCYDLLKRKLENKSKMPVKFTAVDKYFFNNKLFILGGSDENSLKSCYYYDVEADWWEELPSLNVSRSNKSIAVNENKIYVFGGNSSTENDDLLKFEMLDLNKMGENNFRWQILKIKNYETPIYSMLYGFIAKNYLLILGGEELNYYEENLKGYLINISENEDERRVVEEFKIKEGMMKTNNPCSTLRGLIVGSQSGNDYFTKFDIKNNFAKLKHTPYL